MNGDANPNESKKDALNFKIFFLVTVSQNVSSTKLSNQMAKESILVSQLILSTLGYVSLAPNAVFYISLIFTVLYMK